MFREMAEDNEASSPLVLVIHLNLYQLFLILFWRYIQDFANILDTKSTAKGIPKLARKLKKPPLICLLDSFTYKALPVFV